MVPPLSLRSKKSAAALCPAGGRLFQASPVSVRGRSRPNDTPSGVDIAGAATLGVRAIWALSLPGKVAPVTSGRYIMDTVYHIMEELGV